MPKAYIIARSAISYRRYITRSVRNGYHCKKPLLSGRQKRFFTWRSRRDLSHRQSLFAPTKHSRHTRCRYCDSLFCQVLLPRFIRHRRHSATHTLAPSTRSFESHSQNKKTHPQRDVFFCCLWTTKKIFLALLRMNSNSCINQGEALYIIRNLLRYIINTQCCISSSRS